MSELSAVARSCPDGRLSPPPQEAQVQQPKYDNFYTPENSDFYSKFRYLDLDPAKHHIRLLRIHPPDPEDDKKASIRCDLVDDLSLEGMNGKYTTISYSAGDPKNTEVIIVNGFHFNAFASLGHALRQARHFWKDKFDSQELLLWADQICIDQSNRLERSHQVKIMGEIYATAEQVLVSLSTEHDAAGGIEWLHRLLRKLPTDCNLWYYDSYGVNNELRTILRANWYDEDFHLGWDAFIKTVLTSSWWSRAWIRQEFIRSPQAYFMAAFESIQWDTVANIIGLYSPAVRILEWAFPDVHHRSDQSVQPSDSCHVCLLSNNSYQFFDDECRVQILFGSKKRADSKPNRLGGLVDNLRDAHLCKASDPRDLIYAFLGISDHDYGVNPDYSPDTSVQDVLSQLARNIISHDHDLDLFGFVYSTGPGARDPDMPSWVPDWRKKSVYFGDFYYKERKSYGTEKKFSFKRDKILFKRDKMGRKDRVLQARGILHNVLQSEIKGVYGRWSTATGDEMQICGRLEQEGDEVWMLYGAKYLFALRRQGQYHELIGEVYFTDRFATVDALVEEVRTLAEIDHPSIKLINIC